MFNFLKKSLKSIVVNEQAVIEKIHNEFDSSGERLLEEAKKILAQEVDTAKGERLKNIGFTATKDVVEAETKIKEKKEKKELAELIEYYCQWYPHNKFITQKVVEEICIKYHLLLGDVNRYKGSVPNKNISEIENFKLREEDLETRSTLDDYFDRKRLMAQAEMLSQMYNYHIGQLGNPTAAPKPKYSHEEPPKEYVTRKVKPPFKICAPETDFDTRGMTKQGYKLIPDPIVLQPVKGGYLIVSKWGLEASDENVVNEKLN